MKKNIIYLMLLVTTFVLPSSVYARPSFSALQDQIDELKNSSDGVILISQERAIEGNVTTGDTPGFPITISQSGSYRLASNLNLGTSAISTNAIEITSSPGQQVTVTIDLNGFLVGGTNVCDFDGQGDVSCSASGSGDGIITPTESSVMIFNGAIRGFGNNGINCQGRCSIERLTIANNGNRGISITATNLPSIITQNSIFVNGKDGIFASGISTIQNNVVRFNLGFGITTANSTITNNTVSGNSRAGLAGSNNAYSNNNFSFNNGGNNQPQVIGGIQTGANVCGSDFCP